MARLNFEEVDFLFFDFVISPVDNFILKFNPRSEFNDVWLKGPAEADTGSNEDEKRSDNEPQ